MLAQAMEYMAYNVQQCEAVSFCIRNCGLIGLARAIRNIRLFLQFSATHIHTARTVLVKHD